MNVEQDVNVEQSLLINTEICSLLFAVYSVLLLPPSVSDVLGWVLSGSML